MRGGIAQALGPNGVPVSLSASSEGELNISDDGTDSQIIIDLLIDIRKELRIQTAMLADDLNTRLDPELEREKPEYEYSYGNLRVKE